MKKPFLGSRRIVDALAEQGYETGRKHVRRLMRRLMIRFIMSLSACKRQVDMSENNS